MRLPDEQYYRDRPVPHCAQGDLYSDVPSTWATLAHEPRSLARGARKRVYEIIGQDVPPAFSPHTNPQASLVVVCNYTCGFVAQPPGQPGYSHHFRQVAPVVPLSDIIRNGGIKVGEARRLKEVGYVSGLLYLPRPPGVEDDVAAGGEFDDDYVALIYRMTTVDQDLLDERSRVARLSSDAQRRLIAAVYAVMGPSLHDPTDLDAPDMSCSWPEDSA